MFPGALVACAQTDGARELADAPQAQTASSVAGQQMAESSGAVATERQTADEQLKEAKHQRILGILPSFGTSYRSDAVSLTAGQKMGLAFRSAVDPGTFGIAALAAGYQEVNGSYSDFGWGAQGYGKRFGAAYLTSFNGTMIGSGILPSLLRQDPRYFRLGHGSGTHRMLYTLAATVRCKHDHNGRWEPNYSNVGGNLIAGGISNLYYPAQDSGWSQAIQNGTILMVEGTGSWMLQEFWPDISRKFMHKDPTSRLDAQGWEKDKGAEKTAGQGTRR